MKKRILLSVVSFFVMTAMWATLKEKYQMFVSADANGKTGATATLNLSLKNQNLPSMWQCTVALPEGVTYVENSAAPAGARYPEGFNPTVSATVNGDGTVTFFCEGDEGTLTNTEGLVATFDVAVAADVALGDVKVIVNSSKLTEPNGTIWEWETPNEFTWTIEQGEEPVKPGDVNADGTVDISDVVEVLYQMANGGTADVNNDGQTDIADVVEVLSIMAAQ